MMSAEDIVNAMMAEDRYSQWLGIRLLEVEKGSCILSMTVREEMCNGFGVCHGGILFSFADSALAFSCNGHGQKTMSIDASISHFSPVQVGDALLATSVEVSKKNKISVYSIDIQNQKEELVARFKGTVYHSSKVWTLD